MVAVATAYNLQEIACDVPESETRRHREAYTRAASAFEICAEIARNTEVESAHYASAARCYFDVKVHQDVVRTHKLADKFTEAAPHCFENNLLNNAVT